MAVPARCNIYIEGKFAVSNFNCRSCPSAFPRERVTEPEHQIGVYRFRAFKMNVHNAP